MQLATLLKVRTITVGITLAPTESDAWAGQLERAAQFNAAARARYEADGYEVVRWPGGFEFARVHAIDVTPDGLAGAADPGSDGMALAP